MVIPSGDVQRHLPQALLHRVTSRECSCAAIGISIRIYSIPAAFAAPANPAGASGADGGPERSGFAATRASGLRRWTSTSLQQRGGHGEVICALHEEIRGA